MNELMNIDSRIYVAGHRGMVGSAIVRKLKNEGLTNIITRTSTELDLCNQQGVFDFFENENIEVDVEYEAPFISQFPVANIEVSGNELVLNLGTKHTACLAEDKCLPPQSVLFRPLATLNVASK